LAWVSILNCAISAPATYTGLSNDYS
jgi:hypothetical protein